MAASQPTMKLPCSSGNPVLINSRKSPRNRSDNNNGRACRRRSLIAWSVCGMVLWNTAGTFRMNYHGLPIPCNTQKNISSSVVRRLGVSLLRDRLKGSTETAKCDPWGSCSLCDGDSGTKGAASLFCFDSTANSPVRKWRQHPSELCWIATSNRNCRSVTQPGSRICRISGYTSGHVGASTPWTK